MFEELYSDARTTARHQAGLLADDRIGFLTTRASQGYKTSTLRWLAAKLFIVAQQLPVGRDQKVDLARIQEVANGWRGRSGKTSDRMREDFKFTALAWFRYLNRLEEPPAPPVPFLTLRLDFATYMEKERGLEASTIDRTCRYVEYFLVWFVQRFLLHSLPPGFQRIRHYGLFASRNKKQNLSLCRELLNATTDGLLVCAAQVQEVVAQILEVCRNCPVCHAGLMIRTEIIGKVRRCDSS